MKSFVSKASSIIMAMFLVVVMLLSGCGSQGASEDLSINVKIPSWSKLDEVDIVDKQWVQLDQLVTYTGFREDFDKLFNINTITTNVGNTKQGSIYTVSYQGKDVQSGNSVMRDAFRNKIFDKYFNDVGIRSNLSNLADKAYTDVESTDSSAITSTLNAYFNLLSESENDPTYEATLSLTRDEFYTLVCKAGTQVGTLDKATDTFKSSVINSTHSDYIYAMAPKSWLSYEDGSLNSENISKPISKLEALYLIVNTYFPDKVSEIETVDKDAAYGYKNAGDLATAIGINSENASRSKSGNLLAYMLKNPSKGLDENIFKAIKVAENLDLLQNIENKDLTQSITKDEAMQLLINTYESENKQYGYLTNTEYPEYIVSDNKLVGDLRYPDEAVSYFPEQEVIFKKIKEEVDKYKSTDGISEGLDRTESLINSYISSGELPEDGEQLYMDWISSGGSTDSVPASSVDTTIKDTTSGNVETTKPATTPSKTPSSTKKPSSSPSKSNNSTSGGKSQDNSSYIPPEMQDCMGGSDNSSSVADITGIGEIPPDTHFN